jgi:AcrR family transcriptional regulator
MPLTRRSERSERAPYHHGDLRRTLVDAALALLAETQQWDFSLREVARRAGVSHNAPYSHFADKRDLLAAVATAGFETLRARMLAASTGTNSPADALAAIGLAYVRFGAENPAHYRLMFGSTLETMDGGSSTAVIAAAAASRAVLSGVILQGAENGAFKVAQNDQVALAAAVLAAWSLVHGLTMLYIDGLAAAETSLELPQLAEMVSRIFMYGLAA